MKMFQKEIIGLYSIFLKFISFKEIFLNYYQSFFQININTITKMKNLQN